jgi:hypothetical protein
MNITAKVLVGLHLGIIEPAANSVLNFLVLGEVHQSSLRYRRKDTRLLDQGV